MMHNDSYLMQWAAVITQQPPIYAPPHWNRPSFSIATCHWTWVCTQNRISLWTQCSVQMWAENSCSLLSAGLIVSMWFNDDNRRISDGRTDRCCRESSHHPLDAASSSFSHFLILMNLFKCFRNSTVQLGLQLLSGGPRFYTTTPFKYKKSNWNNNWHQCKFSYQQTASNCKYNKTVFQVFQVWIIFIIIFSQPAHNWCIIRMLTCYKLFIWQTLHCVKQHFSVMFLRKSSKPIF